MNINSKQNSLNGLILKFKLRNVIRLYHLTDPPGTQASKLSNPNQRNLRVTTPLCATSLLGVTLNIMLKQDNIIANL